jgi:hypothetical protein
MAPGPERPDAQEDLMRSTKATISKQMTAASVALANATADPEVQAALAAFGYTPERLAQGRALLEAADMAVSRQVAAFGEWKAACARKDAAEESAHAAFQALSQTARAAFLRDKAALATLALDRPMPRTKASFVTMAGALFDNAVGTPSIATVLAGFGYSTERLNAEAAKVQALADAFGTQEAAKGTAQQATVAQDKAMSALADEMSAFRRIAKVALRDRPQLLEKLGILRRSAPTAAQRNAGKKAAATRKANEKKEQPELVGV